MDIQPPTQSAYASDVQKHRLEFTGSGSEYFRIWIVNAALTLATCGIYIAWAKVRSMQYFHRNTRLDGASFDFHGDPLAILKGRVLGLILFGTFAYGGNLSPALGLVGLLAVAGLMPWLIRQGTRFRAQNTSYRGLRFHFTGTTGQAYRIFGLPVGLMGGAVLLGNFQQSAKAAGLAALLLFVLYFLLLPYFHLQFKRYQQANLMFGRSRFRFTARTWTYAKVYLKGMVLYIAAMVLVFGSIALMGLNAVRTHSIPSFGVLAAWAGLFYLAFGTIMLYMIARFQNVVWNHTQLEGFQFKSNVRTRDLLKIWVVNLPLLFLTLGLYWPFAITRVYRLRLQSVLVEGTGDLESFAAHAHTANIEALGSEAADLFDIDISL